MSETLSEQILYGYIKHSTRHGESNQNEELYGTNFTIPVIFAWCDSFKSMKERSCFKKLVQRQQAWLTYCHNINALSIQKPFI